MMNRRRLFQNSLLVVPVLLALAVPVAAADLAELVPGNALGYVVVNDPASVDAKVGKLGEAVGAPPVSLIALAQMKSGLGEGIDLSGQVGLVAMPGADSDADPIALVYVPVTDFKAFVKSLGAEDTEAKMIEVEFLDNSAFAAERDGYAILAEKKARKTLQAVLKSKESVQAELGDLGEWIDEQSVAVVLTSAGWDLAADKALEGLEMAKVVMTQQMSADEDAAEMVAASLDMYALLFKAMKEEVGACVIGAQLDARSNLRLATRGQLDGDGAMAEAFSAAPALSEDWMKQLPSGPFVVAGSGAYTERMAELLMEFSSDIITAMPQIYGIDPEHSDELVEKFSVLAKGLRNFSFKWGVGQAGDPLMSGIFVTFTIDDATGYVPEYAKVLEEMKTLSTDETAMFGSTKATEVKVGGHPAVKVTMDIPMAAFGGPDAAMPVEMEEMLEKMYGPDGKITFFLASVDEDTVALAYTKRADLARVLAAIDGSKGNLSTNKGIPRVAKMLPEGSQWAFYVSPAGIVKFANRAIGSFLPEGMPAFELPDFPFSPPIGFGVKVDDGSFHKEMVVPAATIKAIGTYAATVQQEIMGQMMQAPAVEEAEVEEAIEEEAK